MTVAVAETDTELLVAYRDGSLEAFEELYDRHARAVLTYLVGMTGDRDAAEDLLQQTFTAFALKARVLPDETNPRAYLLTSARNAWINRLRARGRDERLTGKYEILIRRRAEAPPAPWSGLAEEETRGRLNRALAELPDGEREVVLLRCQADLTFGETARMLGIPQGTAASRYRAAMARLKTRLSHE
jgi:RNA polymerase sigma-70 factor (ECF subfamily)